jgi:predicted CXXCH cytochrome family protein
MQRIRFTLKIIFCFVCLGWLYSYFNHSCAELTLSKHDFTSQLWNAERSLCGPCHQSHNAVNKALWGRKPSATLYTMHPQKLLAGTIDVQPSAVSRFCLSCHDGIQPLEQDRIGHTYINAAARIGPDLRTHHPVSIVYTPNTKLFAASTPSGLGRSIAQDLLKNGKVECTSCHDVHNRYNNEKMLNKKKDLLCQTCHTQDPK